LASLHSRYSFLPPKMLNSVLELQKLGNLA